MLDLRLKMFEKRRLRRACATSTSSISHHQSHIPRGISLIEVLISMFVLLFGLMGVAAIIPVGNHYVVEGEKSDLGAGLAQNAFEELKARGALRTNAWVYAGDPPGNESINPANPAPPYPVEFPLVISDLGANSGNYNIVDTNVLPGRAFVIDPMGAAAGFEAGLADRDVFPYYNLNAQAVNVGMPIPWQAAFSERRWPVRRVTLPIPDSTGVLAFNGMPKVVAETIFRLRDDLSVDQPDKNDVPSIQRWDTADTNNTPDDLTDDLPLRRQYKGDYSWLATIVPETTSDLESLQPAHTASGNIHYDVSVVVFRKRDDTPSVDSERVIQAELLQGGELVIYSTSGTPAKEEVDAAVEDIRPGNWISLMGVNQTTGDFVMKWYRILSMDDETTLFYVATEDSDQQARRMMLIGPDWPAPISALVGTGVQAIPNLRAGLFPGAISVVTKPLLMEKESLWSLE